MSEVKGTLLTIILTLAVFGVVSTLLATSIKTKAESVSKQFDTVEVSTSYATTADGPGPVEAE